MGSNPCLADNEVIAQGQDVDLQDGSTLNLLLGRFQYKVEFTQNSVEVDSTPKAKQISTNKAEQNSTTLPHTNGDGTVKNDDATSNSKSQKRPISEETSLDSERSAKRSRIEGSKAPSADQDESVDDKLAALRKQAELFEKKASPKKNTVKQVEVKRRGPEKLNQGSVNKGPQWIEKDDSLVVYTSSGVRASNWVS